MKNHSNQQITLLQPLTKILKNKKHLFIDLDGTLANSLGALSKIYFAFLKSYGVEGSKEEFVSLKGMKLVKIVAYFKEKYGLEGSIDSMHESYKQEIKAHYQTNIHPFDSVKVCLKQAVKKGFSLYLCTQNFREVSLAFLQKFQLEDYFQHLYCGDDGQGDKTLANYFTLLGQRHSINLSEALLIDDSLDVLDIASKQGVEALHFSSNSSSYPSLASWEELSTCLCNL